jgi:hypothetical protein
VSLNAVNGEQKTIYDAAVLSGLILRKRLSELDLVAGRIVEAEVAIPPWFARDALRQMSATLLEFGVEGFQVRREYVNSYR